MATFSNQVSASINPPTMKTNQNLQSHSSSCSQTSSNYSSVDCSSGPPHTNLPPFKTLPRRPSHRSTEMAGLGVLLETQKDSPKYTHIISKTFILKNSSTFSLLSTSSSSCFSTGPFLEQCYLCREKLQEGKDIYVYR